MKDSLKWQNIGPQGCRDGGSRATRVLKDIPAKGFGCLLWSHFVLTTHFAFTY